MANGSLLLSKISLPPLLLLRDDVDYDSFPPPPPPPLSFSPKFLGSFDHYLHLAPFPPSLFCSSVDREIFSVSGLPSFFPSVRRSPLLFKRTASSRPRPRPSHPFPLYGRSEAEVSRRRSRYVKISGSRNLITERRESLYLPVDEQYRSDIRSVDFDITPNVPANAIHYTVRGRVYFANGI